VIVKVAEFAPAGTTIVAGTVAASLFEDSITTEPPAGAGADNRTVPVTVVPPITDFDANVKLARIGGWIVRRAR